MKAIVHARWLMPAYLLLYTSAVHAEHFKTRVHLWFAAFIPKSHPGRPDYIIKTVKNTYVIRAPGFIGPASTTCFSGDDRDFDSSPTASARIRVSIFIDIDDETMSLEPSYITNTGVSHNVDCTTGTELQPSKRAPLEPIIVYPVVENAGFDSSLKIDAVAANPFYPNVKVPGTNMFLGLSPDIDMNVVITYNFLFRQLEISGKMGVFPAFEGYYSINGSSPVAIFQLLPYKDSTAWSLPDLGLGINTQYLTTTIKLH